MTAAIREPRPAGIAGFRLALRERFNGEWSQYLAELCQAAIAFGRAAWIDRRGELQAHDGATITLGFVASHVHAFLAGWADLGELPVLCPSCSLCLLVAACVEAGDARRRDDPARALAAKLRLCQSAVLVAKDLGACRR